MLYRFHVNVFARPAELQPGPVVVLRGLSLPSFRAAAFDAFLPVTFEQAVAALTELPRIDAEPDGFFVVSGDRAGARWQVDGHLFDFDERLHRVELHGECPPEALDAILRCVGDAPSTLAFELVMEGVTLDEAAFRAWASSAPSAGAD